MSGSTKEVIQNLKYKSTSIYQVNQIGGTNSYIQGPSTSPKDKKVLSQVNEGQRLEKSVKKEREGVCTSMKNEWQEAEFGRSISSPITDTCAKEKRLILLPYQTYYYMHTKRIEWDSKRVLIRPLTQEKEETT